ncbi:MAG: hypothetical protein M3021_01975 [Actinomycetota bacterium]|nr:hypothetical protein [Actinomycetota bacterium]
MEMHELHSVDRLITPASLHGIIDGVGNEALMLALDLQADLPDAGEVGGPTTQDKDVEKTVSFHFETHINGGTNTVGMGENVTQNVQIGTRRTRIERPR